MEKQQTRQGDSQQQQGLQLDFKGDFPVFTETWGKGKQRNAGMGLFRPSAGETKRQEFASGGGKILF